MATNKKKKVAPKPEHCPDHPHHCIRHEIMMDFLRWVNCKSHNFCAKQNPHDTASSVFVVNGTALTNSVHTLVEAYIQETHHHHHH
jgi:hypothetical protein